MRVFAAAWARPSSAARPGSPRARYPSRRRGPQARRPRPPASEWYCPPSSVLEWLVLYGVPFLLGSVAVPLWGPPCVLSRPRGRVHGRGATRARCDQHPRGSHTRLPARRRRVARFRDDVCMHANNKSVKVRRRRASHRGPSERTARCWRQAAGAGGSEPGGDDGGRGGGGAWEVQSSARGAVRTAMPVEIGHALSKSEDGRYVRQE